MTRAYLAFTEKGLALAQKLAGALPGTVDRCGHGGPGLADWAAEQFAHADALIFVGAVGIAVRAIAPHCRNKAVDPAVVVLDECGHFAVPILSGHLGGANDLARALAAGCGKAPQQPQERSKWDILSAKCGEADCTVSVTKNWGGQETGLSCVVFIPPTEGMDMTAVPLTLRLSEGATLDETEPCIVSIDGMSLVVDLTVSNPCITVQNEGYTRTYCLRLKEAMG